MASCAVCGEPCRPPFRVPAAEQAPDLDGRPGEPARSTLLQWVQACRNCGAAAPDLGALSPAAAAAVGQAGYAAEPNRFLRWAALCDAAGDRDAAAEAVLQAAWAEEDAGRDGTRLRGRAAAVWVGDALRRVDILRRAGSLDEARALAATLPGEDAERRAILAFQRDRIAAGDTGRHLISSALRPPARSPHAAHRRAEHSGWLGRLFGG